MIPSDPSHTVSHSTMIHLCWGIWHRMAGQWRMFLFPSLPQDSESSGVFPYHLSPGNDCTLWSPVVWGIFIKLVFQSPITGSICKIQDEPRYAAVTKNKENSVAYNIKDLIYWCAARPSWVSWGWVQYRPPTGNQADKTAVIGDISGHRS